MGEATELPNLGSLWLDDEDAERPRWVRRAQEEWSQELGGFPRGLKNPVLTFLVKGTRHSTEWYLPRESSLRLSIALEYLMVSDGGLRERLNSFLAIPEFVCGDWVLGRVFHSVDYGVEGRLRRVMNDAASESGGIDMNFDVGEIDVESGAMYGTVPFAACLDGSNMMFTVQRVGELTMVTKTRAGCGNSLDSETIIVLSSGDVARKISFQRRCPFCAARGVPCECARSFRERSLMDMSRSLSWEDFVSRNRRVRGDDNTLFDLRVHVGGRETLLPFRQTSSFHFQDDDVLREMRYSLLRQVDRATLGSDLLLDVMDSAPGFLLVQRALSMPSNALSDTPSISAKSKLSCSECGRAFSTASNLRRHRRAAHEGLFLYKCDLCEKTFAQRTNLVRHRGAVHEGLRAFECEVCHARFSTRANLSRHANSKHSGETLPPDEHTSSMMYLLE